MEMYTQSTHGAWPRSALRHVVSSLNQHPCCFNVPHLESSKNRLHEKGHSSAIIVKEQCWDEVTFILPMLNSATAKTISNLALTVICQLAFIWPVTTWLICYVLFACLIVLSTLMIRALFVTGPLLDATRMMVNQSVPVLLVELRAHRW